MKKTSKAASGSKSNNDKAKLLADRLERAATRTRDKGLADWKDDADNKDMIKMVNGDYKDAMKIVSLMRQGKISQAGAFASTLDTAASEAIPSTVMDFLDKNDSSRPTKVYHQRVY